MRILFVIPDGSKIGGCEAYRMMYPARALEMLGEQVAIISYQDMVKMMEDGKNPLLVHDMVVFQRMIVKTEEENKGIKAAVAALRASGIAVVVDYDDDYTNKYRVVCEGDLPDLSAYSAVTVTNKHLANIVRKYGANAVVLKNAIVPDLMDSLRYKRVIKGLTVGLTGSASHEADWPPAERAILELIDEGLPITGFISGYIPPSLKGRRGIVTLRDIVPGADRDDFFVDLGNYGGIHANIDILLCPVDPKDKFNWSKSNLKAIEGMASRRPVKNTYGGSCVIATGGDLEIYKDAVIHDKTGLLINNHDSVEEWKAAIRSVAMNVEYRNKLQIAGHQLCMKRFDITKTAQERLATYRELVSKAKKEAGRWEAELAEMEKST